MATQYSFNAITGKLDQIQNLSETIGISDLSDITITSATAGDILRFNGSVWINTKTLTHQITSSVSTGTSPFSISSTTVNTNLNADLLDGLNASDFIKIAGTSTTTAVIPFAQGISIPDSKFATFGTTNSAEVGYDAGDDGFNICSTTLNGHIEFLELVLTSTTGQWTATNLYLYANQLYSYHHYPVSSNLYDVGSASSFWRNIWYAGQIHSTVITGTSPFVIASTTVNTNLNADLLDGLHSTAFEVPITFSTGLTRTVNTVTVNTSQNISTLSNLTTNGFVKTTGSNGTLSIDTNTYLTAAVTSIATSSPITGGTITSTGTIGFDFSTTNVWTGTNKINVNSTTAFFVEQDGVNDNVLVVDTTNNAIGIGSAPVANTALTMNGTWIFGIDMSKTIAISTGAFRALRIQPTWSGAMGSFSGGNIPQVFSLAIGDSRTVTSTGTDRLDALNFSIGRDSGFTYSKTGAAPLTVTLNSVIGQITDNGTYTNTASNSSYLPTGMVVALQFSPTFVASGRTVTATNYLFRSRLLASSPVLTSGTLNSKTYGYSSEMNNGWTVGTGAIGFAYYGITSGFTTNWNVFNDSVAPNFLGGDNSKSYFGTGTNTLGSATGAVGDVFIQYTGTIWDFDIAIATTSIDFNRSLFDTDFNVWGNTLQLLHLDANAGASWFQPDADNTTAFQFRDAAANVDLTYDSTNQKLIFGEGTNITLGTTTGTKIGTATTEKIGFFNATPIVQQTTTSQTPATFVANTSLIVDDSATWDGYTVGDVVKILRTFGLLA